MIVIALLLIFFAVGFFAALAWNRSKISAAYDNGYDKGWDAAKERLYETGVLESVENDYPVKSVIGDIQGIDGDKLYLQIEPVEALAKRELDDRVVVINENTKVYKYVSRSQEEIESERQELERSGKLEEPALMKKQEVPVSQLDSASRVIVYSEQDIKNDKQFQAIEIIIHK